MPREFKPIYRTKINDIYIRVDKIITPCKCNVPNCKETDCYDIQIEQPEGLSFMGGTFCERHLKLIFNIAPSMKCIPKGHGRLIILSEDAVKREQTGLSFSCQNWISEVGLSNATVVIIEADKEQEDTYNYLLHGAKSLVKDYPDLVRDIWNCSSCEHTEDECKDCYPELGYKNNKLRRDTEAVKEFVESDAFTKLMESFDEQDRAATEDVEQFLRDIKAKEQEE